MVFVRRFSFDPGNEVITEIEGMVLIGREPPGNITGAGSGAALCVAEYEDGPYNTPLELEGGGDLLSTFGGFGYTVDGVVSSNPCARSRLADSAVDPEYWNGNGFIALVNKAWGRLMACRVDTSVGAVEFSRLPSLDGTTDNTWNLEPAQTLVFDLGAGSVTATFDAAVASLLSADGTYPSTFVGGESMNVTIDAGTSQQIGPIDIVFQSGDSTHAQVVARINAVLGYTAAAISTLKTTLVGRNRGTGGSVKVNSVSAGIVTTATGFSAATATGTGDVSNIDAVTFLEAKARIEADVAGTLVSRSNDNAIRVAATALKSLRFVGTSTAVAFGFVAGQVSQEPDGFATLTTTAGTYPNGFVGGETLTLGFDGDPDVTVSFQAGDTTRALTMDRINAAVGFVAATANATATKIDLTGRVNGGQVRIVAGSTGVFAALGLAAIEVTAIAHSNDSIPAGTRVRNDAGVEWVTTQSTPVAFNDDGPYSCRVRPALDDGTNAGTAASSVTVLPSGVGSYAWSITNPLLIAAALSESAIDAAYQTAFDATLAQSAISKEDNIIFSARQSNACRAMERQNVISAQTAGMAGRVCVISPPLGTTRTRAKSSGVQPGVGVTRNKDVIYAYPGVRTFIPQIAARGVAGGAGFTADGLIDVHFDSWAASTMSQLPPEQNPGQQTDFMAAVRSLESGNADVQSMTIDDYIAFKRSGIAAPIIDDGVCQIQSAVTSVNPTTNPGNVDISQRRFEYFIQDSFVALTKKFSKKTMTRQRRAEFLGILDQFLLGLKSPGNDSGQRIEDYSIDAISPNTKQTLGQGIFRTIDRVRMLPDFKYIVFETLVGPNVDVTVNVRSA